MMRALPIAAIVLTIAACAKASAPVEQSDAPPGGIDARDIDAAVLPPDGNGCGTQPCDILPQCGCGAGACDIDFSDLTGTACRQIIMQGNETATCSLGNAYCSAGFVCLGGAGGRSCKKYCSSNADCAAPRGQCVIDITANNMPIAGIPSVCSSGCDPTNVGAGGCPTGWKCNIFTATHGGQNFNITDCAPPPTTAGTQGANCKVGADGDDALCAANFLCTTVNAGTNFNCRRTCNNVGAACPTGGTCIGFNPAFTVGGTQYGVCN
ncbi:MAG: hypothetical protein KIT31_28305 [Deltaproteobacteria bacterium]|nr:hypothetical protein [Deltaproteobacteria bacterium]